MIKGKLYYSITEVSELTGLRPHILRYWETEFPTLRPKKNRAGNRAYRQKDIDMILLIKKLLYEEGYTIDGARRKIKAMRGRSKKPERGDRELLEEIYKGIKEILSIMKE